MKTLLAIVFVLVSCSASYSAESPKDLWKGLIGEATGEGYDGMYAVACCVRNRLNKGMNHGLVALRRKDLNEFCRLEGKKREEQAKEIVRRVFEENSQDVVNGADHYESIKFPTPSWAKHMKKICKIKQHVFYHSGKS